LVVALLIGDVFSFAPFQPERSVALKPLVQNGTVEPPAFPALRLSADGRGPSSAVPSTMMNKIDWNAMVKYSVGLTVQMSLIYGFFTGIDKIVARFSLKIPFWANVAFLYGFNLKSSFFSILPGKRSDERKLKQEDWEYNKRNTPSWTPPGFVFGIMWPLFTFGLRAVTAAMIVQSSGGSYATSALMSLMLHLGFGNLWNTV